MLNADTKTYEKIISNQKTFKLLIDAQPQFSKDGKKIYFLAEAKGAKKLKDETGREAKVRTIYSYDLDTKTFKKYGKIRMASSTAFLSSTEKITQQMLSDFLMDGVQGK